VTSVESLVEGRVYFELHYADEAMLHPYVRSLIYLGTGVLGGAEAARTHFFQSVESYFHDGSWALMSGSERDRLGPDEVICCDSDDVGLISDSSEFIDMLTEYRSRASKSGS
jgi:hypothetical protein